jgi:hypothetical protein
VDKLPKPVFLLFPLPRPLYYPLLLLERFEPQLY